MADETLSPVPAPDTPPAPAAARLPRPPRSLRGRLVRWALRTALGVALVAVAALLFVLNAGRSEAGTAALLAKVPGLTLTGLRGSLWGDTLRAEQLHWQSSSGTTVVSIDGLAWTGLVLRPLPQVGQWLRLDLATLHADTLRLTLPPSDPATPTVAPTDLSLPLALHIRALSVGRIHANTLGTEPLRDLQAQVQLGADFGHTHRLDGVQIGWDRLQLSGQVQVTADAPMALQAQLSATQKPVAPAPAAATSGTDTAASPGAATPPAAAEWRAQAQISGTLTEPHVQATVRGRLNASQREQTLDAQATLRPFEAWPLARLSARAQDFDLAALSSAAPTTALSGEARALTTGRDQPVTVELDLRNSQPGRWDQQRLPVTRLQGSVRGLPQAPNALSISGLNLQLGNSQQAAGQLTGEGHWTPQRWALQLQLRDVQPLLLDQRASAMRVGGPVQVAGSGLGAATGAAASPLQIDVKADLRGQLQQAGTPPVKLQLDASVTPLKLELRALRADAGAAQARLSGTAQRADASGRSPWRVLAQGQLSEFDPLPWWPGPAGSPWRQGPHQLNGTLKADLTVPGSASASPSATQSLSAPQGQAELQLSRSLLAGVAVEGLLAVRSAAADASGPAGLQAQLKLDAAGNRLSASGRLTGTSSTSSQAAAERWSAEIDAPQLATLAPWASLFSAPARGQAAPLAGSLKGSAQLQGRWPAVRSSGTLSADTLRWQGSTLQQLQASWQAGSSSDDPLNLQLSTGPLRQDSAGVESVQLGITGTLRQHRISGTLESTALPPAWTELLLATPAVPAAAAGSSRHSVAQLDAHGELLSHTSRGPSGWRGVLDAFTLRSHGPTATPLLRTQAQALSLNWLDTPLRLQLQPGRAELLGTAVRWNNVVWQAAGPQGQAPQLDLDGELETLAVAPLLARLQPEFGWGGDLQVGAQIKLRSTPQITADIVFERLRGDLSVTDDAGVQALGLTDLRLALNAQDHVWSFTQALAGKTLGVAAGAVIIRTTPAAPWPGPQSPLSGVLEAQVANLGTWGAWVPTGWRLGGALRTSATLSGRLGAPEYTGEVRGNQLSVRNVLQGVNVSDGEVAIALQGASARIETFTAKAGAGTLQLEGDASLGETPRADLRLSANKVALLGRVDRRIVTSGNARLLLDATTLGLTGAFKIDEGLIDFSRGDAPSLADDVVVVRATQGPAAPAATSAAVPVPADATPVLPARQRNVSVDLQVDLGERLRLLGRGLNTGLRGALHLTTPGGRMALNGSVSTADGTYAAYGQNLNIDRGTITFNGTVENPRLDIEATRPNLDVRVGVIVSGTAQAPRVRLFSEPELADLEKLSWLVMGRASDGLGRADTALLQTAAVALLSGEGEGVTTQFTKAIGLDELSLRQNETGDVRETVVSLGKQLSRRWYVGYERGLNATTGTWQLIYRIAQRFTLRAQSGLDNSLDVIWTWRWK